MKKYMVSVFIIFSTVCFARVLVEEPIQPLPPVDSTLSPKKVELGKLLFVDTRLSANETISCAFCHVLSQGGVDHRKFSIGIKGQMGDINAPTVFNSGFNFVQFWNGRAKTLEDQVDGPVQNEKEMGATWPMVVEKLSKDPEYQKLFKEIYADGITPGNIRNSIAEFEKSLVTSDSKFDRYLQGDVSALKKEAVEGYRKFKAYGCVSCHQGVNIGGNMYQLMGVMGNYFKDRGTPITSADLGRYTVTGKDADKHVFRVPSLRNVELTAPYFHDGSTKNLEEAVKMMAKYQLGRNLSSDDVSDIVEFLKALTGEKPESLKK